MDKKPINVVNKKFGIASMLVTSAYVIVQTIMIVLWLVGAIPILHALIPTFAVYGIVLLALIWIGTIVIIYWILDTIWGQV